MVNAAGRLNLPGERLRSLLQEDRPILTPGCGEALTARMIQEAGFEAVFVSGYWCSSLRGLLDVGLITLSELCETVRAIVASVDIPVVCDADTGFGEGPIQVQRCIRDLERAGAAGLALEDQVSAKKCGLAEGKSVISKEAMADKIRAAADVRSDGSLVLIARTDALDTEGVDGAIVRGKHYLDAGADLLFVEGFRTIDEVMAVGRAFPSGSLVFNQTPPGYGPDLPMPELSTLGYRLVLYPIHLLLFALRIQQRALKTLREDETCRSLREELASIDEVATLLDEREAIALEQRYTEHSALGRKGR